MKGTFKSFLLSLVGLPALEQRPPVREIYQAYLEFRGYRVHQHTPDIWMWSHHNGRTGRYFKTRQAAWRSAADAFEKGQWTA